MNVRTCRACGSESLSLFLDLGFTPLADRFLRQEQLDSPETYYPLKVLRCNSCGMIQLSYVVPPDILYCNDYPYESSTTSTGRMHFDHFAASVVEEFGIKPGELAADIGSNVGVLLGGFAKRGCRTIGFDPASNIAEIATRNGIETVNDFFSPLCASDVANKHGRAKVITGSNVFAHIDNIKAFMEGVDSLLEKNGILVIEAPYFSNLLLHLEYDTIYHEHLSYISITPLVPFFDRCGFKLFDVRNVDIHGGSIRLYVCRKDDRAISPTIDRLLTQEANDSIHNIDRLKKFASDVKQNSEKLCQLIQGLKSEGKSVAAVSAPAKGMTLLNYSKIDSRMLDFATEKSKLKIGRFTPGGHLKVMPDDALLTSSIDYALLLAWNFKDEIAKNLSNYREVGGKFIVPIPSPTIM